MKINHYIFSIGMGIGGGILYLVMLTLPLADRFKYSVLGLLLEYFYVYIIPPIIFIGFFHILQKTYVYAWEKIGLRLYCISLFLVGHLITITILVGMDRISIEVFLAPFAFLYDFVLNPLLSFSIHPYSGVYILELPPAIIATYLGTRDLKKNRVLAAILILLFIAYITEVGSYIIG